MRSKIVSTLMLVVLILNSSVVSHPAISKIPSDVAENNREISPEDSPVRVVTEAPVSNRAYTSSSTNSNKSVFSWRNLLLPSHFGEFFEVFVFFMELKWHYEIEDAIAAVGHRINGDQHHPKDIDDTKAIGDEAEYVDGKVIEHLLDRAKYLKYYLNAMAPVYGYHRKSERA